MPSMPSGNRCMLTGRPRRCGSITSAIASKETARSSFVRPSSGNSTLSGLLISTPATSLADDIGRQLVGAEPEVPRVSELAVAGPLGVRNLRHQAGLGPVHALARDRRAARAGRGVALEARQARVEVAQHRLREAGADLAGVHQV